MMQDFPAVYRKKDNAATEAAKDEDGTGGLLSSKFKPVTLTTQAFYRQVCITFVLVMGNYQFCLVTRVNNMWRGECLTLYRVVKMIA